jgi:microcystin-dependent protein
MADIAAVNWNEVDASNTAAAPDGSPEGMAPSGVNNVLRAHQGAIKRWYNHTIPTTTTGTAGTYLLAYTVPPTVLTDGDSHTVSFHAANDAAATLNVGGLGATPLHYYSVAAWRAVPAALLGADQVVRVAYHASSAAYRILDLQDRTGELVAWAGATAPAGTLLCSGQAISRTDYAGLFAAISDTHGVGDGSSTFNLPDLRGRVAAGKDDMGGTAAGRLTSPDGTTLGAAGGVQSQFLGLGHMPTGMYTGSATGPSSTLPVNTGATAFYGTTQITALPNVQPTLVLNYVIRI